MTTFCGSIMLLPVELYYFVLLLDHVLLYNEREVLVGSKACDEVFKEFHDSAMGGHSGVNKTQNAISKRYYWPNITADIKSWVNIMITTYYVDLVMDWVTEKLFLKDFSPKILFGEKQCRDNFNLT